MYYSCALFISLAVAFGSFGESQAENMQLTRQKKIFDMYTGVLNAEFYPCETFDFSVHAEDFHHPEILKEFLIYYKEGEFLPMEGVFTTNEKRTKKTTLLLFDLFYTSKHFEIFIKLASWARKHINPEQFTYAFTLALLHRQDCQKFMIPAFYEILPHYFTPVETMKEVHRAKMMEIKEGHFHFNNTGYVYNYHEHLFGGPLNQDASSQTLEYLMSYFREDIGLNAWFLFHTLKFPTWLEPEHYRDRHWYKRGENAYYMFQQLFAMYTLHRMANGLPYVEKLEWEKPIKFGYNPRVTYHNGKPLFYRPDHIEPKKYNIEDVEKAQLKEIRLKNGINSDSLWHPENSSHYEHHPSIYDGTDLLGRMVFGMPDVPNGKFFGNYFADSMKALSYTPRLNTEHELIGTAMSTPPTALRDPAFYQYLNRLIKLFQELKKNYHPYSKKDFNFLGVSVKEFEIDKLITYFEHFEYELTNGVPMKDEHDYDEYLYHGKQERLNHKPFHYKVLIRSEFLHHAMVRVFIGPKFDAQERPLNLEQSRLAFVELDRFPVNLTVGEHTFERSSKESPLFSHDPESFRNLYKKVIKSLKHSDDHYDVCEEAPYKIPARLKLPPGWKNGQPFTIAVIVTPYEHAYHGDEEHFYAPFGHSKLYDTLPLGFPFDRPAEESHFHVPNIYFKDVLIYHKDETDIKKSSDYY